MTQKECVMCGQPTTLACSICLQAFYCGQVCQRRHWEQGHMNSCGTPVATANSLGSVDADDGKGSNLGAMPRAPQFLLARRDSFRAEAIGALQRGDWSAATTAATHAHRLAKTFYGENHPDMLVECIMLACSHTQTDHYQHSKKQANVYLQEALELSALNAYEDGAINAVVYSVLGEVAGMMNKPELAVQLFNSYIDLLTEQYGAKHLVVGDGWLHLSRLHCGLGSLNEALSAAKHALQIRVEELGLDHAAVADSRYNIGVVHLLLGSAHDAQREFTAALDMHISPNTPQSANLRYGLGMAEHQIGAYSSAHNHYLAARRIREVIYGKEHVLVEEVDACLGALKEDSDNRIQKSVVVG